VETELRQHLAVARRLGRSARLALWWAVWLPIITEKALMLLIAFFAWGVRSRFAREITFPDYYVDALQTIFHQMLAQHEYTLEPDADQMLRRILTGLHAGEDSGNARFARTLFEQALNRQALRLSLDKEKSLDALDRDAVMTFTADDIVEAALALGEEPEPEPTSEPERPRWWRWLC
jgi:stage V sporulation protein K